MAYFVKLENKEEMRHDTLEGSMLLIKTLEGFERIKATRVQRVELTISLNKTLSELENLFLRLRQAMPRTTDARPQVSEKPRASSSRPAERAQEISRSEIDSIEAELARIEKKLKEI